jgi:ribonuclease HI
VSPPDEALPRAQLVFPALVEVHFDGACQPPRGGGVATYGFVIEGEGLEHEESGLAVRPWSESASNNVAEYVAAINALVWLRGRSFTGTVLLLGDSQLVVRQMQGEYEVRSERLRPYHDHLVKLVQEFTEVRFAWVPREENQRADALSKEAFDRASAGASRPPARALAPDADDAEGPTSGPG